MPDWETSFFPHKCFYCGKRIKRKTPHICIWGFEGGVNERYCDPHCAKSSHDKLRKERKERELLKKIIDGGEE